MSEDQTYCIIDRKPISAERVMRRSVTCSKECAKQLARFRRAMTDARSCRQCHAPSTPAQRKQFAQWRRESGQLKRGRPKAAPKETA